MGCGNSRAIRRGSSSLYVPVVRRCKGPPSELHIQSEKRSSAHTTTTSSDAKSCSPLPLNDHTTHPSFICASPRGMRDITGSTLVFLRAGQLPELRGCARGTRKRANVPTHKRTMLTCIADRGREESPYTITVTPSKEEAPGFA
eukprot:TRINITY_DN1765_c0_g5_i1.p1 TRINITY_DN1765_c0_g5~~TRINITY_DN1765_c0_g5_i1.p1  ORF type:complete len:162 (+),score=10.18 TRINITY_DN1765_c0_g5_i1:57-488(+)